MGMDTCKQDIFSRQKRQCLSAVDLSRKGSIDEPIVDLVSLINSRADYFTTSSCSGRVCVHEEEPESKVQKRGCRWLYTTHSNVNLDDMVAALKESLSEAYFKFEAFIMHVQCRSVDHAQLLHSVAVASGFRNSGISVGKKGKIIMAVRSTHSLEVPLSHKGRVLVSEEYLKYLCEIANKKMKENTERINRFSENLKQALDDQIATTEETSRKNSKHESLAKQQHASWSRQDQEDCSQEKTEKPSPCHDVKSDDLSLDTCIDLFEET